MIDLDAEIALHGRTLLRVRARVPAGGVLTLMGPSGSGKSSLVAWLGGFLDPAFSARGHAIVDGEDVTALPASGRRMGILFQDPLLFPHLSVEGNLLFALPADVPRRERRSHAARALEQAGLEGFGPRDPATLSGGQRARVALMRTLLARPRALLLDEPFSKLDADLRQQVRGFVFDTARARDLPVLLVTHDEADAEAAGGEVVRL